MRCKDPCNLHRARVPAMPKARHCRSACRINIRKKVCLFDKCSGSRGHPSPPVTPSGPLVGRDNERALLTELVKELSVGRGGSALIEGEPGIGNSALVRTALAEAPAIGCQGFW